MLKAGKELTKNPLGIIGLFIVMVYGLACAVLGVGASHLSESEKIPLVWFIVLFPVLILVTFYNLVTKHHKKLYAPSDFKNEELFFEQISDDRRNERLENEIKSTIKLNESQKADSENSTNYSKSLNLNIVKSTYADAERLAFLALEAELKKPFRKYVKVNVHGREVEFDGLLLSDKEVKLIEVRYFNNPIVKRDSVEALMHHAGAYIFAKAFDEEKQNREVLSFCFVAVVDFECSKVKDFKNKLKESLQNELYTTELRVYQLNELRERYG